MTQSKNSIYQIFIIWTRFNWFLRLHESYKIGWSAFVFAYKEQLFSHKTAYYAQVEAQALTKKTAIVRHYALKAQQKGWCNVCAANFTLNYIKSFSRGPGKNW